MNLQAQMEKLRRQRAAEWYQIMRSREAGDSERQQFTTWIAESPLNSAAYFKIVALSREMREAAREAGLSGLALVDSLNPKVVPLAEPPIEAASSFARKRPLWCRPMSFAVAVVALLTIATFVGADLLRSTRYSTGVGEERTVRLKDGSVIQLNAQSSARVRMTAGARDINLDGDAFFQVARDTQRPFNVHTAQVVVRAVGTSFNVSARASGTHVAVTEGKVQVSHERSALANAAQATVVPQPIALEAGEAVRVLPGGTIDRSRATEVANALAWREHLVVIDGLSLEEAVAKFNTHQHTIRLRLEDVSPGSHHYSGTFYANDPNSFVDFLAQEHDLVVEKQGNVVVIRQHR